MASQFSIKLSVSAADLIKSIQNVIENEINKNDALKRNPINISVNQENLIDNIKKAINATNKALSSEDNKAKIAVDVDSGYFIKSVSNAIKSFNQQAENKPTVKLTTDLDITAALKKLQNQLAKNNITSVNIGSENVAKATANAAVNDTSATTYKKSTISEKAAETAAINALTTAIRNEAQAQKELSSAAIDSVSAESREKTAVDNVVSSIKNKTQAEQEYVQLTLDDYIQSVEKEKQQETAIKNTTNTINEQNRAIAEGNKLLNQRTNYMGSEQVMPISRYTTYGDTFTNTTYREDYDLENNKWVTVSNTVVESAEKMRKANAKVYDILSKLSGKLDEIRAKYTGAIGDKGIDQTSEAFKRLEMEGQNIANMFDKITESSGIARDKLISDAEAAIKKYDLMVRQAQNEQYAATSLRTRPISTIKDVEINNLDKIKSKAAETHIPISLLIDDFKRLTSELGKVNNKDDLVNYLNDLDMVKSKIEALAPKSKQIDKIRTGITADLSSLRNYKKLGTELILDDGNAPSYIKEINKQMAELATRIDTAIDKNQRLKKSVKDTNTADTISRKYNEQEQLHQETVEIEKSTESLKKKAEMANKAYESLSKNYAAVTGTDRKNPVADTAALSEMQKMYTAIENEIAKATKLDGEAAVQAINNVNNRIDGLKRLVETYKEYEYIGGKDINSLKTIAQSNVAKLGTDISGKGLLTGDLATQFKELQVLSEKITDANSFAQYKSKLDEVTASFKLAVSQATQLEKVLSGVDTNLNKLGLASDFVNSNTFNTNFGNLGVNNLNSQIADLTDRLNNLKTAMTNTKSPETIQENINSYKEVEKQVVELSNAVNQLNKYSSANTDLSKLSNLLNQAVFKQNGANQDVVNLNNKLTDLANKYKNFLLEISKDVSVKSLKRSTENFEILKIKINETIKSARELKNQLSQNRKDSAFVKQQSQLIASIDDYVRKNSKAMNTKNGSTGNTFGVDFENIKQSAQSAADSGAIRQLADQTAVLKAQIKSAGLEGSTFFSEMKDKAVKFIKWTGMTLFITKTRMYFRKLFTTVYELDTALIDLKKTFQGTDEELNQFYYDSNKLAKQLGVTTKEIIEQGAAWSRLGYNSKESMEKMAEMSSMFASISPDMNTEQATNGLVSIMKAFKITPNNVLDGIMSKVNIIGNTAATSNGEIVEMLQKSSAAMKEANNTLEETIALETAAVEITRDSASVGTAYKTISARLRGLDEETLEVINDTEILTGKFAEATKTINNPGGLSLFTDSSKQTYKSTYQIIKELTTIWDDLSDAQHAKIEEIVGGKRQLQIIAASISNFEAAEKAMDNMANSAGNAQAEMNIVRESVDFAANELKETFTSLAQNTVSRDFLKSIINSATRFIETISDATPVLKLLLSLFSGVAKVATGFVDTIGLLPSIMAGLSFKNIGVFRVINNDATKLSDRLTFLKKSFTDIGKDLKSGVGVKSFTSIVTAKDVNLLNDFNNAIQGGTNYTKAFDTYLSKVPISIKRQGNELIQLNNQMLKLNNAYKNGKVTKQEYNTQMSALNGRVNNVIQSTKTLTVSERIATGVTKGLGVALNLAFNIGLGIVINLIVTAIYKLINAQKEYNEKTKELAENIRQEKEEIKDLYKQYIDISKEYAVDKSKKEDLIKITDDLLEKLGHEKTTIQELIDEYGNLDNAIQNITYENLKEKRGTLSNAKDVAENELKDTYKSIDKSLINNYENYIRANIGWNKFWDDIGGDFLKEYREWYKKSFSVENAEEFIKDTNEFISRLEDSYYQDDLKKIKIYSALVASRDDLKKSLDEYNASVDKVNKNEAEMAIALAKIDTEVPKTQEEFDSFKNSIINTVLASDDMKKHFVGDEKEIERAITNALKEMPEYIKFFAQDLPDSTDKNTLSVKKLTDAYEELSDVLDDLFSKQDKLADLYEKIAKSTELSASEARELIELFPELTSHLVRVGSKWSFDIKGVNEAFDKLEDEFVQKAQETIDNNKKILEQSFEDYYAENTKLNLDSYLKENEIDTSDTNSLDYKAALLEYDIKLQKERNALLESYEELHKNANSEIEKAIAFQKLLNNQINGFDFDVDNYNDKIKELMDASEKMAENESLSYDELVSLIDKFPELTYSGSDGEYYIEKSALDELIKKSYEERNARIDDEIAKTYAVNEEVENRVKAYESEKERLENAISENRKKYNESYDNPNLTEGILERIELESEHTKLIKELNALDKEQYEADKALMESQSEYSEAYRKYLEALKENLTSSSSNDKKISDELQNQIDYYNTIIDAVSAVKDRYTEVLDNEIDALEKSKDALKDANDERQRELDLIEARNNLENAKKRKVYVYTEGEGFKQVQDQKAIKEAEEKYRDVITDIQIAEIDKAIEEREKQKESLEQSVKDLLELEQNIQDSMAISQAMKALGLSDPSQLLSLPESVKEGIINGLADATVQKDIEDNKENVKHIAVTLDDVLANLGSNKKMADLSPDILDNVKQAAYKTAVQDFADALKANADNMVKNVSYNNSPTLNANFNIYDANDPQTVAETVHQELNVFLTEYYNAIK